MIFLIIILILARFFNVAQCTYFNFVLIQKCNVSYLKQDFNYYWRFKNIQICMSAYCIAALEKVYLNAVSIFLLYTIYPESRLLHLFLSIFSRFASFMDTTM